MGKSNIRILKDVWIPPFFVNLENNEVHDDVGMLAFTFEDGALSEGDRLSIVERLNNEFDPYIIPQGELYYLDGELHFTSTTGHTNRWINIRGWSTLVGETGLQFTTLKADRLQEKFADFIIDRLSNNEHTF